MERTQKGKALLESGDKYAIQDYMKAMSMVMNAYGQAGGGDAGNAILEQMGGMDYFKDIVGNNTTIGALTKAVDSYGIDMGGIKEEAKLNMMNGTFDASRYTPMGWAISAGDRAYEQVNNDRRLTDKSIAERMDDINNGNAFKAGFRSRAAEARFGSDYYNDPRMFMYKIGSVAGDAKIAEAWTENGGKVDTSMPSVENDAAILMSGRGMESYSVKNRKMSANDFYKMVESGRLPIKNIDDIRSALESGLEYKFTSENGVLSEDLWDSADSVRTKPLYSKGDLLE